MKKSILTLAFIVGSSFITFSIITGFNYSLQQNPWKVPDAAKNKKNPIANDEESLKAGKSLWATHCKSCHGTKGLGDGSKAAQLKTDPGDFSTTAFQANTDGALFFKTSEGRDDMPAFKKKLSDEDDRWHLVNYMRTFKK
ncbi:MAG: c-type cytochrome [Chitinophagaceae bacterium]|nr:c-type cytochrome [Chitinophagaceae bacterium]